MDYEKKYKESMRRTAVFVERGSLTADFAKAIFDDFEMESDDEKIRKAIIEVLKDVYECADIPSISQKQTLDSYIAYLEKQGEQKKFINGIQVGDKVTRNEDGVLVNLSQLNRVAKPAKEYNITGIGSKNAKGKLGEMIRNLNPLGETIQRHNIWSKKLIVDVFEMVGLAKIAREQGNDALTESLQSAMIELAKYSVVIQPKQEWSEEDKEMIRNIIDTINIAINDCDVDDIGTKARFSLEKERAWLKSLRPQNHWKPSEEQMEALEYFIVYHNGSTNYAKDLEELRLQLDKLKKY